MAVKCSLCGKTFKSGRGRQGHLNFYHGYARETPFTRAIRWEIHRRMDGVKKPEEEKIKDRTKKEERREKAIGVLREYEKSMAAMGDNSFTAEIEMTEDGSFIDEIDIETDSKFIDRVEFE